MSIKDPNSTEFSEILTNDCRINAIMRELITIPYIFKSVLISKLNRAL